MGNNGKDISFITDEISATIKELKQQQANITTDLNSISTDISGMDWQGENAILYKESVERYKNKLINATNSLINIVCTGLDKSVVEITNAQNQIGQQLGNMGMIATSAAGALAGKFINTSNLNESVWNNGKLEYIDSKNNSNTNKNENNILNRETNQSETPVNTNQTQFTKQHQSNQSIYSGKLATKSKASDETKAMAGVVTSNNQTYKIVPDNEYTGLSGTISESQRNLLIAQVAGESGNSADDMLGVTSTVLNRLEQGGKFGNSVNEVLEKGYFPWGESYRSYIPGGKFFETDWGQEKLKTVEQVVDDALLCGVRNINSNTFYYTGNGEHNIFSDVV